MSPSLDQITQAVVERLHGNLERLMAQAQRKYPQHRRSPRAYIKSLKYTSRTVPVVRLPTGPLPDEPWFEPDDYEDEGADAEVPLIGEAMLAYQREHSHRTKMSQYQSERAIASLLTVCRLHENEPIWSITRQACKAWRTALLEGTQHLPTARNKRVPGPVTIEKRLKMVEHFIKWCVEREYLPTNPMQGLSLPKRLVAAAKTKKGAFTDEELAKIIPALLALPAEDLPRTEFKWASLALMWTGARCMEICNLRQQDIRQVEGGYWIFDILTVSEDHRVKNDPSVRKVPIHSQLVALGFLDWVKAQGERVFPNLYRKRSQLVSLWFTRMLKTLGIKRPSTSLHSLRYTMTEKLALARTYPPLQNRILGHAIGQSVEDRVYLANLTFTVKETSEALERVTFPTSSL